MATGWQKLSEKSGFMTVIQDQVFSNNDHKKHVLKDPNITNDIFRKCRENLGTIQHTTSACCALAQGNYIHHQNQVAIIVHQELTIKCGLSKGPPILYYKHEPQSVSENSRYKPSYDRPRITDQTTQNNRPDIVQNHQRSILNSLSSVQ